MHNYAGLTSTQKADWKALADTLNNGHSDGTPGPYSGANAYMIVNLYRRLNGQPYSDDAPTDAPPSALITGLIKILTTDPRAFAAALTR